jgi:hypothetical protein
MISKSLLCFVLLASSPVWAADPAKWFTCESSDDCILARGPCGAAAAVNRSYRGKFEKKSKGASCQEKVDFKKDRKTKNPACGLDSKCVTVNK